MPRPGDRWQVLAHISNGVGWASQDGTFADFPVLPHNCRNGRDGTGIGHRSRDRAILNQGHPRPATPVPRTADGLRMHSRCTLTDKYSDEI